MLTQSGRRVLIGLALPLIVAGSVVASVSARNTRSDASVFTVAAAQGISSLDPAKLVFAWEQVTYTMVFDSLTQYTRGGGEVVEPDLASKWRASNGLKTYTFTLRSGVKFSNGEPLTAADVVANFHRYLDVKTGFFRQTILSVIKSVTAPNPGTVVFQLSQASRSLPDKVSTAPIVYLTGQTQSQLDSAPIGTGPFEVKSFVPNGNVDLVRNPDYWGAPAPSAEIVISRAPDNTSAVTSLQAGNLSALFNIPWPSVKALRASGGGVVSQSAPAGQKWFDLDNTSPPFNNVYARRALSLATDRATILKTVYFGNGALPATNGPLTTQSIYASKTLPRVQFNLAAARKLFRKAGVTSKTTLTYWTPGAGQYPDLTSIGEILQSDLAKIGIKLQIKSAELSTWAARFYPPGKKYPGLIVGNSSNGPGGTAAFDFLTTGGCECNYSNRKYDAKLKAADAARTAAKSKALYDQALTIAANDSPIVEVALVPAPIGTAPGVSGIWLDPTGNPRFEDGEQK